MGSFTAAKNHNVHFIGGAGGLSPGMAAAPCSCSPAHPSWETTSPTASRSGEKYTPPPAGVGLAGFQTASENAWST